MKKIIIYLLTIIIIISFLFSCNVVDPTPPVNTTNNSESTTRPDATAGPNQNVYPARYRFNSIKDFETYVLTGSKNSEDYSTAPDPSWPRITNTKEELKYFPLTKAFGINMEDFWLAGAALFVPEEGKFEYEYYLNRVLIRVLITDATSTKDCIMNNKKDVTSEDFSEYEVEKEIGTKYAIRNCGDIEIIYSLEEGIKRGAWFLCNGFAVEIRGTEFAGYDKTTLEEEYQLFITAEEVKPFSAFFSDDPEIFAAGVERVMENLRSE